MFVVVVIATLIGIGLYDLAAGTRVAHERRGGVRRRAVLRLALGRLGIAARPADPGGVKSISDRVESLQPVSELLAHESRRALRQSRLRCRPASYARRKNSADGRYGPAARKRQCRCNPLISMLAVAAARTLHDDHEARGRSIDLRSTFHDNKETP